MDFQTETIALRTAVKTAIRSRDYNKAANIILSMLKSMPPAAEHGGTRYLGGLLIDRVEMGFAFMIDLARLPAVPQDLKERMYRRSVDSAADGRWPFEVLRIHWTDVLMALRKGREEEVFRVIDSLLALLPKKVDELPLSRLLSKKMTLLRELGRDEEVSQLVELHPLSPWLWDHFVDEADKKKGLSEALELAERARAVFKDIDNSWYNHFDAKAWMIERRISKAEPPRLAKAYAEAQDWNALFELLKETKDIFLLREYTQVLLPHYMGKLLPLYKKSLLIYAEDDRSRHAAANTMMYEALKMIRDWPGGQKVVNELVADFHQRYDKRKKLLELLDELVQA